MIGAVTNSVLNGKQPPIQTTVTDVEKCFDKPWLQAAINLLHEAGLSNDLLHILYWENKEANIADKVNGKLSKRIEVQKVVMQGSVWGGLKCTMDKLNKLLLQEEQTCNYYMGGKNILIGVLSMVDDTLSIAN